MEKRVQDYSKEILKIIRSNTSPAVMGERLQDYHENDLADVMPKLTVQERCKLYRILDTDMLSDTMHGFLFIRTQRKYQAFMRLSESKSKHCLFCHSTIDWSRQTHLPARLSGTDRCLAFSIAN